MSTEELGKYDMEQTTGVAASNTLSLEERKIKALEKIAYNTEVIADAVDDLQNGEWPDRIEYYLFLLKENYLKDPNA